MSDEMNENGSIKRENTGMMPLTDNQLKESHDRNIERLKGRFKDISEEDVVNVYNIVKAEKEEEFRDVKINNYIPELIYKAAVERLNRPRE